MSGGDIIAAFFALLLYPGLLASGLVGAGLSALARRLGLEVPGFPGDWRRSGLSLGCALAMLAASQLEAPSNPIPADQHNLLLALVALCAASWTGWAIGDGDTGSARGLLGAQLLVMVAVLAPALLPQDLRPQVVAGAQVPLEVVTKVAAAAAYLLALPILLGLTASGPRYPGVLAGFLWFPALGLFASLYAPLLGGVEQVLAFFGVALLGLAASLALSLLSQRRALPALPFWSLSGSLGALALILGVIAASGVRPNI